MKNNITIGMDLGDRDHVVVVMDENGEPLLAKVPLLDHQVCIKISR